MHKNEKVNFYLRIKLISPSKGWLKFYYLFFKNIFKKWKKGKRQIFLYSFKNKFSKSLFHILFKFLASMRMFSDRNYSTYIHKMTVLVKIERLSNILFLCENQTIYLHCIITNHLKMLFYK